VTNGFVDRPGGRWDWVFERSSDDLVYLAADEGYVLYRHLDRPPAGPEGFRILVLELIATTPTALRALWATLGAASSVVPSVIFRGGPADPLAFLLDGLDVTVSRARHWMLRLVDVAAAIAARGWAEGVRATVSLEIVDRECAWNAGRFFLLVEDGRAHLEPGGKGSVRLGIGALSSLYSGYASTAMLGRAGLLDGGTGAERAALDLAFAAPVPWMLDEF
jgi:predicted acetyltransferase